MSGAVRINWCEYNIEGQRTRSKKGRKEQQRKQTKGTSSKAKQKKWKSWRSYFQRMLNSTTPSSFQRTMFILGIISLPLLFYTMVFRELSWQHRARGNMTVMQERAIMNDEDEFKKGKVNSGRSKCWDYHCILLREAGTLKRLLRDKSGRDCLWESDVSEGKGGCRGSLGQGDNAERPWTCEGTEQTHRWRVPDERCYVGTISTLRQIIAHQCQQGNHNLAHHCEAQRVHLSASLSAGELMTFSRET